MTNGTRTLIWGLPATLKLPDLPEGSCPFPMSCFFVPRQSFWEGMRKKMGRVSTQAYVCL